MQLAATVMTWEDSDGVAMLGFADQLYDTGEYFLIQFSEEVTDEEVETGLDKNYLEINGKATYGVMERVDIYNDRIEVTFDSKTALRISSGEMLRIDYRLVPMERDEIQRRFVAVSSEVGTVVTLHP